MNDRKQEPEDTYSIVKGFLKETFETARANVNVSLVATSKEIRTTLKDGEKLAGDAYTYIENTVGKDRVIGAMVGAKVGGLLGMRAGVPGMFVAGTAGAVVGLLGGRKFLEWYKHEESNDNKGQAPTKVHKPDDPAP